MTINNAEKPAYPLDAQAWVAGTDNIGLTKREYFAAMAMQGTMAALNIPWQDCNVKYMSRMCLEAADALLEALDND